MNRVALVFVLVLAVVATVLDAQPIDKNKWRRNPLLRSRPPGEIKRMERLRRDVLNKGCDINLCFALDGSSAVNDDDYLYQKNFVDLIVAITTTDEPGNYCGVQFHNFFTSIAPLTQNLIAFLDAIQASKQAGGRANLEPALRYALKQLRRQTEDANMIIFFSKSRPLLRRRIHPSVTRFLRRGGAIGAVAMEDGFYDELARVTGDLGRVVPLDGFFDLSEIVVAVVSDACNLPCSTRPGARRRYGSQPKDCPTRLGEPGYERPKKEKRPPRK